MTSSAMLIFGGCLNTRTSSRATIFGWKARTGTLQTDTLLKF
jgi:hypothetical protein